MKKISIKVVKKGTKAVVAPGACPSLVDMPPENTR
jgi:hypothetical protein